jgi:pilus assembly protein TadC
MNPVVRRWLLAGAAGIATVVVLGGVWGLLLGMAAGAVVERQLRGGSTSTADDDLALALPLACDLLAVCLESGTPPGAALAAVADASPGPLGEALSRITGLYRLGAEPTRAWAEAAAPLDGLARAFVRAGGSGSSTVPALRALAVELRSSSRARTDGAVRRAGVWVLAPLGACFLPAFLCLGVVPLVLGIARDVFG